MYWTVLPTPVSNSPCTLSRISWLTPVISVIENLIPLPSELIPTDDTPTPSPTE